MFHFQCLDFEKNERRWRFSYPLPWRCVFSCSCFGWELLPWPCGPQSWQGLKPTCKQFLATFTHVLHGQKDRCHKQGNGLLTEHPHKRIDKKKGLLCHKTGNETHWLYPWQGWWKMMCDERTMCSLVSHRLHNAKQPNHPTSPPFPKRTLLLEFNIDSTKRERRPLTKAFLTTFFTSQSIFCGRCEMKWKMRYQPMKRSR